MEWIPTCSRRLLTQNSIMSLVVQAECNEEYEINIKKRPKKESMEQAKKIEATATTTLKFTYYI